MTTNRNLNFWLRKVFRNFICGFCLGIVIGILGIAKGGGYVPPISVIIIFGLILGTISAIFGRSFWLFGSRRNASEFPEQTGQSIDDTSKNNSVQQDSTIP